MGSLDVFAQAVMWRKPNPSRRQVSSSRASRSVLNDGFVTDAIAIKRRPQSQMKKWTPKRVVLRRSVPVYTSRSLDTLSCPVVRNGQFLDEWLAYQCVAVRLDEQTLGRYGV